jgi:hypothetical protein
MIKILELLSCQADSMVDIIGTMFLDDSTNGKGWGSWLGDSPSRRVCRG